MLLAEGHAKLAFFLSIVCARRLRIGPAVHGTLAMAPVHLGVRWPGIALDFLLNFKPLFSCKGTNIQRRRKAMPGHRTPK